MSTNQDQTDHQWNVSWGGQPQQPWTGLLGDSAMCAKECAPMAESAATPEHRLASAIGGWVHEALRSEGLEVVERDSPRAIWHSTLTRASSKGDGNGVAALLAAGQRHGWLA